MLGKQVIAKLSDSHIAHLIWSSEEKEEVLMTRGRSEGTGVCGRGTDAVLDCEGPFLLKDSFPPKLGRCLFASLGCRFSKTSSCLLQARPLLLYGLLSLVC